MKVPTHVVCFATLLAVASGLRAQTIAIANPGFEEDIVLNGAFNSNITPAQWTTYDPTGVLGRDYSDVGVLNPTGTSLYTGGAPQGSKVALVFLWPQSSADYNQPVGLQQTLSATLQSSTLYTLTVQVGNIASDGNGSYSLVGFPGYSVQLYAGSTLLAQDNNTLAPADGTFALSTVSFTTGASHAALGEALTIRLLNLNVPNSGIEVNFDDVQLTASAIPEPSSYALATGLIAVGLVAWRRRRASAR